MTADYEDLLLPEVERRGVRALAHWLLWNRVSVAVIEFFMNPKFWYPDAKAAIRRRVQRIKCRLGHHKLVTYGSTTHGFCYESTYCRGRTYKIKGAIMNKYPSKHCPKCGSPDPHYVSGWSGIGGYYSCEVPK